MIVANAVIHRTQIGTNLLNGIISQVIQLSKEFETFQLYQVKRNLNTIADYRANVGTSLSKGVLWMNGKEGSQGFPLCLSPPHILGP